jgi:NADH-ubiquinone oxidoreductase chain 2
MVFTIVIYTILSNAVATRREMAVLYSRSTLLSTTSSMLFVFFIIDWYFFDHSIGLYNGLLYCNLTSLIFISFLFLLGSLILTLTSFYPNMLVKGEQEENDNNISLDDNDYLIADNKNQKASADEELGIFGKKSSILYNLLYNLNLKEILQAKRGHYSIIEYPLITLFIVVGSIALLSSNDLVTIFLAIELQSYGLYILCTLYRNSESSTNAGLTYFLLGGLSSCIILLGQSLLYINLGHTNLDGIYIIHNIFNSNPNLLSFYLTEAISQGIHGYYVPFSSLLSIQFYQYSIQLALIIVAIGFLFKISASPFHSWSPGVYDAIPTVTTTFVAIMSKISIFILLFDLVYSAGYTTLNYSWKNVLLFSSFLSLIIGSVLGLTQFRIKRLYAYSTISHVGFILLALCVQSVESIQAFFFYIIQYSLSNLNAFIILIAIGYSYTKYTKLEKNTDLFLTKSKYLDNYKLSYFRYELEDRLNRYELEDRLNREKLEEDKLRREEEIVEEMIAHIDTMASISMSKVNETKIQAFYTEYRDKLNNLSPITYIDQLKGYFYLNPVLAISLSVTLYSFIGIPPLVGFFAKQMILSSALDNGYVFMCLIAILTSVISAVYYLYIIKHLFFEKSEYKTDNIFSILSSLTLTKLFGVEKNTTQITLSSWLTFIISILSLIILLFIFLYHETYFLLNILSILIIY